MIQNITIIGLGYIGLPTALLFAKSGYNVFGYDVSEKKISLLKEGKLPFEEPGLKELFFKAKNNFFPSMNLKESDVYLIAVPTPLSEEKYSDISFVVNALNEVKKKLKKGDLVIVESTIPPSSSRKIFIPLLEESGLKVNKDFYFSHCPERAIPGNTLKEMKFNHRIIGSSSREGALKTKKLYLSFVEGNIFLTNLDTAEMVKLMENTYRDVNIALANEFAKVFDSLDTNASVWEAIQLANLHPRVNIHNPGPGVGGHCIPIDPWFLSDSDYDSILIQQTRHINDTMANFILSKIKKYLDGKLFNKKISLLGVAYKGNVDDARETPTTRFVNLLLKNKANIKLHDPHVKEYVYKKYFSSLESSLNSEVVIIITDHKEYEILDFNSVKEKPKIIFDSRNIVKKILGTNGKTLYITFGEEKFV